MTATGNPLPKTGKYACPGNECSKTYDNLADLFQHMNFLHKFRQRWLVIDRDQGKLYVTDRAGVTMKDLPEQKAAEALTTTVS